MNKTIQKRCVFVLKSMMWSLVFYCTLMIVFNWDDLSSVVTGKNAITIVNSNQVLPLSHNVDNPEVVQPNISKNPGIIPIIFKVVKTVSGLMK